MSERRKFHTGIALMLEDALYLLLKICMIFLVGISIISIIIFVLPVADIREQIFEMCRQVFIQYAPLFPFSNILLIFSGCVLIWELFHFQRVIITEQDIIIRRILGKQIISFNDFSVSFEQKNKALWKREKTFFYMKIALRGSEEESSYAEDKIELFNFDGKSVYQLKEKAGNREKKDVFSMPETEISTGIVRFLIPRNEILEKELKSSLLWFVSGCALSGLIGYVVTIYGAMWKMSGKIELCGLAGLFLITGIIRMLRFLLDKKRIPERIYIADDYLNIDSVNYWLGDVEQISFNGSKKQRDMDDPDRWYFQFLYKGKKVKYFLGTESSINETRINDMKKQVAKVLEKYPDKIIM